MEGSNNSFCNPPLPPPPPGTKSMLFKAEPSELHKLQKEHEEKEQKIQHLKSQIQALKLRLETKNKNKNQDPDDKKQAFHNLMNKYNSLREEYTTLLAETSRAHNN